MAFPTAVASTVDSEDGLLDISTSPTTPDGSHVSLGCSPVLQALKLQDALEEAAGRQHGQRSACGSLDAALYTAHGNANGVKNICCVGAGYVGKSPSLSLEKLPPHVPY
jgi:UDPglucose 6-dehydrogenase